MSNPTTATDEDGRTLRYGDIVGFKEGHEKEGVIDSISTRKDSWSGATITVLTLKTDHYSEDGMTYTTADARDCWLLRN